MSSSYPPGVTGSEYQIVGGEIDLMDAFVEKVEEIDKAVAVAETLPSRKNRQRCVDLLAELEEISEALDLVRGEE